ncbi:general transcription factor IIIA, b [Notolabrus celidotus]|uniref:general transcription factor IIIA, b n=1 Tax=Notolabrus celidotus TaxID=1203425 RepID=UPI00148FE3C0|nr:general transcription factor IIIA, b [Notolabrus celidotus]
MGERLQSQKSYVCSFFDCKAKFSKSWKLEAHLCKHTGLKPFSCESCDKSFCTRYQLTRHELNHSGEKQHKCLDDGCSEAFITNNSMKNHMARVHRHQESSIRNNALCDHKGCGKDFNKRNQLKAHKGDHQQILPFRCSFNGCAREFPTHGKLKHHEGVHAGYPCEDAACSFHGKTWTEYLKHRNEHKVKVQCAECKKLFNNAWFLRLHELHVHTGEKTKLSCPRKSCDKKFTRRFNLESHILGDHEGKKPFSCAYAGCGKRFAMKESLWRHGAVHDPAKKKLKKLHPKKNQPWRVAEQLRLAAAAKQAETKKLTARLRNTSLKDVKP